MVVEVPPEASRNEGSGISILEDSIARADQSAKPAKEVAGSPNKPATAVAKEPEEIIRISEERSKAALIVVREALDRAKEISLESKQFAEASAKASEEAVTRAEQASREAREAYERAAKAFEGAISKAEETIREAGEVTETLTKAFEEAVGKARARVVRERWLRG
jgi:hypothetical protein